MKPESVCFEVLLVDDNPEDVILMEEVLREAMLEVKLNITSNGVDALSFLRCEGGFIHSPRPDLILMDLNMPGMNGHETLAEIKKDPDLKAIPVIILSTSSSDEDIRTAYQLQASCYVTKPVDLDQYIHMVKSIHNFWFTIVKLPRKTE